MFKKALTIILSLFIFNLAYAEEMKIGEKDMVSQALKLLQKNSYNKEDLTLDFDINLFKDIKTTQETNFKCVNAFLVKKENDLKLNSYKCAFSDDDYKKEQIITSSFTSNDTLELVSNENTYVDDGENGYDIYEFTLILTFKIIGNKVKLCKFNVAG